MLRYHLRIALRTLLRNRLHTLMNLVGLGLAVACCLLLYQYLRYEWSWDRFHEHAERICLVNTESHYSDYDPMFSSNTSELFYATAHGQVAGVQEMIRVEQRDQLVSIENRLFETEVLYADPELLTSFTVPIVTGDGHSALKRPDGAIVTEEFAARHFPGENPLKQVVLMQYDEEYVPVQIEAVMHSFPPNSTLQGDIVLPWHLMEQHFLRRWGEGHWGAMMISTYLLLEPGVTAEQAQANIRRLMDDLGITEQENRALYFYPQPLLECHMKPLIGADTEKFHYYDTDMTASLILLFIALAILTIAGINMTTMTVGLSARRTREIGVMKVVGAQRAQLKHQFYIENGLLVGAAILLGIVLAELLIPAFSRLADTPLQIEYHLPLLGVLLALWLVLTLATGGYPAQVMAGFSILQSLMGTVRVGGRGRMRKILILSQFIITITLISITFIMANQLRYITRKNLGYHGEQVVVFPIHEGSQSGDVALQRLRTELQADPGILSITGASCPFNEDWTRIFGEDQGVEYVLSMTTVDPAFISTLGIELIEGKDFADPMEGGAGNGMIVNETFAREIGQRIYGWESPIGQTLPGYGDHVIIGMVRDFHFATLHETINPMCMITDPDIFGTVRLAVATNYDYDINFLYFRLAPDHIATSLQKIEALWPEISPDWPFTYHFIDESVAHLYREDRRWNRILTWASGLAVMIAMFGILGITILQVVQRTKEIGIRKVLGAEVYQLLLLLTRELILIVVLANLVALPIAWLISQRWLENFAYSVHLTPLPMIAAGILSLLLALAVAGGLIWRVARLNPTFLVRDE